MNQKYILKKFKTYYISFFVVLTTNAIAQTALIEVLSAVDTSEIFIGDQVNYSIVIKHKAGLRVEQPGEGLHLGAFEIKESMLLKAKAYNKGSIASPVMVKNFWKSQAQKLEQTLRKGIKYSVYNGIYRSVYDWNADAAVKTGVCSSFDLSSRGRDEWYGIDFEAYLKVPADGEYTFTIYANDGCQMKINDEELFESDGRKSESLLQEYKLNLAKGFHKIEIAYYQCSDANELSVYWESDKIKKQKIPAGVLFY